MSKVIPTDGLQTLTKSLSSFTNQPLDEEAEEADETLASEALVDKTAELQQKGHEFIEKLPCCLGCCARNFVNIVFCPSVKVELSFKIFVAVAFYTTAIVLMIIGLSNADDVTGESLSKGDFGGPRSLHVDLTACVLAINNDTQNKNKVTLVDSTIRSVKFKTSNHTYIFLRDSGTAIFASCVGPPKDQGFLVAAHLQVGTDVQISSTTILLKTAGRSSLMLSPAPYGSQIDIRGDSMITQIDSISVPSLSVVANQGLVDIRNSNINDATISAGMASISVSLPKQSGANVELHRIAYSPGAAAATASVNGTIEMVQTMATSTVATADSLCISDTSAKPVIKDTGAGSLEFALDSPSASTMNFNVTRGCKKCKTIGQFYFTRGVSSADRSEVNTYDSTGDTGYTLEADYAAWATTMYQSGRHILRFRALGAGIDNVFASVTSRSEWVYSHYSDVYIWHPASQFWINTLGLFSPETARADVLFATAQCTPRIEMTDVTSTCSLDQSSDDCSEAYNDTRMLGVMHAALWGALPTSMTARNSTLSELYYVKNHENIEERLDGAAVFTSIGGCSVVTKFTTSAYEDAESTVSDVIDGDPWKFMDLRDKVFWAAWWFLVTLFPIVAAFMVFRFYLAQRDKIIVAKGDLLWPRLWAAQQEREVAIAGRPCCKWAESCYRADPHHREKYCHPGDPDWVKAVSKREMSPGAQVQVMSDKHQVKDAFEHAGKYHYMNEMDETLGCEFTVQEVKPDGMVVLQVKDKRLFYPVGVLSQIAPKEQPSSFLYGNAMKKLRAIPVSSTSVSKYFQGTKTKERDQMEKRAHRFLANSTHFFTVIDAVVLTHLPETTKVDGLPSAFITALLHWAVSVGLCIPVYSVCWLQLQNIVDEQTDCAFVDMIRADCLKASDLPFNIILGMILFFLVFMLFYTIIVYLCRQIDEIFPTKACRNGRHRMSVTRRRLFRIRASWPFSFTFWALTTGLFMSTVIYFVSFVTYITLAACVFPERLTPVLLGVVAVVFVAKETYSKLNAMRHALEAQLKALPANADQLEKTIRAEMIKAFDEKLEALALGVKDAMEFRRAIMEEMCNLFEETLHKLPGGILDALGIDKNAIEDMCDMFDQNLQSVPGANGNPLLYAQSLQMSLVEEFQAEVEKVLDSDLGRRMKDAVGVGGGAEDGSPVVAIGRGAAAEGDKEKPAFKDSMIRRAQELEDALKERMVKVLERKLLALPASFGDVASWPGQLRTDLNNILKEMLQSFEEKLDTIKMADQASKVTIAEHMSNLFQELVKELITAYAGKIVHVGDAVIFGMRSLEEQLQKLTKRMRAAFEKTVEQVMDTYGLTPEALSGSMDAAAAIPHAIDDVLREHGFNTAQIVLVTVVTVLMFAVFLAFILLGCSLFMHPNSMLPSLISSGMVLVSTFSVIKSGKVNMAATGNSELTKSLHSKLAETQKMASSVPRVGAPASTLSNKPPASGQTYQQDQ